MARYVAEGAQVTLVTCTLGEYGDVVHPDLAHVNNPELLGAHRLGELNQAMAALGVTDFIRLGGDGTYHDSGHHTEEGTPWQIFPAPDRPENAFWDADLHEAALHLVATLRDRRPHVLVTYNPYGGYGHPDHIQAHRVAMYAVQLAGVASYRPDLGEAWLVPRVLWGTFCAEDWALAAKLAKEAGLDLGWSIPEETDDESPVPPMVARRRDLAAHVSTGPWLEQQRAALRAHKSQVDLDDPFWAMMTADPHPEMLGESYLLAAGRPTNGLATDIFEGLDLTH